MNELTKWNKSMWWNMIESCKKLSTDTFPTTWITLKTLYFVKEGSPKWSHTLWFHFCKISRIVKSLAFAMSYEEIGANKNWVWMVIDKTGIIKLWGSRNSVNALITFIDINIANLTMWEHFAKPNLKRNWTM
jgi:hypothetical protein